VDASGAVVGGRREPAPFEAGRSARPFWCLALIVLGASLLASCDWVTGGADRTISIQPSDADLMVGDSLWLEVVDSRGSPIEDPTLRWARGTDAQNRASAVLEPETGWRSPLSPRVRVWGVGQGETPVMVEVGSVVDTAWVTVRAHEVEFASIRAGHSASSCGLSSAGEAYCWGSQYLGPSPDGTMATYAVWTPRRASPSVTFTTLDVGASHQCGLDADGRAHCWGTGPTLVTATAEPEPVPGDLRFAALSTGAFHTCGLTTGGEAYCWGLDQWGQLGIAEVVETCGPVGTPCSTAPVRVTDDLRFMRLAAGTNHTCGLTVEGDAYCWGANTFHQLGNDEGSEPCVAEPFECRRLPDRVVDAPHFQELALGGPFSCGLTAQGQVHCWGTNERGQLGTGVPGYSVSPVPLTGSSEFVRLTAGSNHACAITQSGDAYCWGENTSGRAGTEPGPYCFGTVGAPHCISEPRMVEGGLAFLSVDAGATHTCGTTAEGAYCWGNNGSKLGAGLGSPALTWTPLRIHGSR